MDGQSLKSAQERYLMTYELISVERITIDLDDLEGRQPMCLQCSRYIKNKDIVVREEFKYQMRTFVDYWHNECWGDDDRLH
jgi:hypothetical protein